MAAQNISALFENNLRKVSEVGVGTLNAQLSNEGDRLGQAAIYAKGGDLHNIYTIPADSIVTKFYFIVDEAFDAGITAEIKTIAGAPLTLVAALDCATEGASVSTVVDTYFDETDGFSIVLSGDVTKGKVRILAEFISASTNNGIYVDLGV